MTAVLLDNAVRTYAWGSHTVLPALLGVPTPTVEPWAEIWVGAHPGDPSRLSDGRSLADVEPGLPYLVKLLAAEQPLSIQAHPDRARAEAGWAAEDARGVDVDAPDRSYRDPNHKPELLVALTTTDALAGFRPVDEIARLVRAVGSPRLAALAAPVLDATAGDDALRGLFTALLHLRGTPAAGDLVTEVARACGQVTAEGPDGTAAAWVVRLAGTHPGDPGAVLPLVLRLLVLQPGDGLFVAPGELHAYLRGAGVEVQAASDNVLRGGLTPKHVDVEELLAVVRFTTPDDAIVRPRVLAPGLEAYDVPVDDFAVRRVSPAGGAVTVDLAGPRLAVCVAGEVDLDGVRLAPGRAAYVPGGDRLEVAGTGTVFVAATGSSPGS